mmetsp:Transcript_19637/g.74307  ORF Transcript_19637/g.74307 Transcript_19637/m.74307 type:complete len:225 (-) Transcript_19637:1989-2663(-)
MSNESRKLPRQPHLSALGRLRQESAMPAILRVLQGQGRLSDVFLGRQADIHDERVVLRIYHVRRHPNLLQVAAREAALGRVVVPLVHEAVDGRDVGVVKIPNALALPHPFNAEGRRERVRAQSRVLPLRLGNERLEEVARVHDPVESDVGQKRRACDRVERHAGHSSSPHIHPGPFVRFTVSVLAQQLQADIGSEAESAEVELWCRRRLPRGFFVRERQQRVPC